MCLGVLTTTRIRTARGLSSAYQVLVWSLPVGPLTPSLTPTGGCAGREGHRAASRTLGSDAEHGITQNDAAEALGFLTLQEPSAHAGLCLREAAAAPRNPRDLGPQCSCLTNGSRDAGQAPVESARRWGQVQVTTTLLPGHLPFTLASTNNPRPPASWQANQPPLATTAQECSRARTGGTHRV